MERGLGNPDASMVETPVYIGTVEILGLPAINDAVIAVLGDAYILGRRVIDRFEVTLDHGQRLIVRP